MSNTTIGHEAEIKDVALVSGSADYTAKIWKVNAEGKVCYSSDIRGRHLLMCIVCISGSILLHWRVTQEPSKPLLVCVHIRLKGKRIPLLQARPTVPFVFGSVM